MRKRHPAGPVLRHSVLFLTPRIPSPSHRERGPCSPGYRLAYLVGHGHPGLKLPSTGPRRLASQLPGGRLGVAGRRLGGNVSAALSAS